MDVDVALQCIVSALRSDKPDRIANYGYDVYIGYAIYHYFQEIGEPISHGDTRYLEVAPAFMNAAWELCRMGVLRPGIHSWGAQATTDGNAGGGFSVTPFGLHWLKESEHNDFIPTEPDKFARMLEPFRKRYGASFHERAQEAIRCYRAHAYLACCVMCGAASESILLAVAIAKSGDEKTVMTTYRLSNGRSQIERQVVGQANAPLKRGFNGVISLLKYWRDISAHGAMSSIGDHEAYVSLMLLLRHAAFVEDNWEALTEQRN